MRVHYIICLVGMFMLTSCLSKSLYTKKQFIEMTDDEIMSSLLMHTPFGTSKSEVKLFIKKRLRKSYLGNNGDTIRVDLAYYDGMSLPGVDKVITARWYFDKNGKLMYIKVKRGRSPS